MGDPLISAFIVCHNEAHQIRRCLESVKWCNEIIIVDSGSTDDTIKICKEYTSKIFFKEWAGYVAQKKFALEQCSSEWILNIDADEVVTNELKDEILKSISNPYIDGYLLLRNVYHLGKWWEKGGWYPEFRLRLCRRSKTSWGGTDPHEKALVNGEMKKLSGVLQHFTYSNITDQIARINRYSSTLSKNLYDKGERSNFFKIFFNPFLRFFKFYFVKKGFLEGFPGLAMAIIESFYVFLKYLKIWELQNTEKTSSTPESMAK